MVGNCFSFWSSKAVATEFALKGRNYFLLKQRLQSLFLLSHISDLLLEDMYINIFCLLVSCKLMDALKKREA